MTAEPGLRERKKEQTRQLLLDTARRLFSERGYEHVSVAEIARAAEVSEATVYNYFPSKEELVFSGLERFEDALLATIRERAAGETVLAAFSRFILEPVTGFLVEEDETAADQRMQTTRMITSSPLLLAHEQRLYARYTEALAQLLAAETRAAAADLRPYVTANALMGVHRALVAYVRRQLLEGEVDRRRLARDVRSRARTALSLLAHGFGEYAAK